jgi:hypothetical protein
MNKRGLQLALIVAVSLVAGAKAGATVVSYHGGRVIPSIRIVPIFYGNTWTATEVNNTRNYLTDLANYLSGAKNPAGKQTLYAQYGVTHAQVDNLNCAACVDANPRQIGNEITTIIHSVQQQNNYPYGADKVFLVLPGPGYSTGAGPCGYPGRDGGDAQFFAVVERDCSTFQRSVGLQVLTVATDPNQGDAWFDPVGPCWGHTWNFGAGEIPLPNNNHTGACPPFSTNPNTPFDTKMGDIVHAVVSVNGGLFHAFRHPNTTSWTGFGNLESVIGFDPGNFADVGAQGIFGVFLHVIGITNTGHLWHVIRTDAGWTDFIDVNSLTGASSTVFDRVGLANVNGDLHVCAVTNTGGVRHAIRYQNGSWTGFGDVLAQTGSPPGLPAGDVACAGIGGDMHLAVTTSGGGIFHAIRFAAGNWSGIGNVEGQAGEIGDPQTVSVANFLGELNVVTRTAGMQFHTIRHSSSWSQFAKPKDSPFVRDLGCAATQDFLHVVSVDFSGIIQLQSRDNIASWSSPFNVTSATGFQATGTSSISATNGLGY